MGSACCVAARDKNIVSASGGEVLNRNIRHSPSWSFRWDSSRGRVAGEDTSISWFSDGISRNGGSEIKYGSAFASEDGSPSESFQSHIWHKSTTSDGATGPVRTPASDRSISRNISMDADIEQVKEPTESLVVSYPSPSKLSLSLPLNSALTTSSLSPQSRMYPASSTTSRWPLRSPGHHLLRQASDNGIPRTGLKSPDRHSFAADEQLMMPSGSNESSRGSRGGSSDSWSMHAFSELMATSRKERRSFDNESWGSARDKQSRSSGQASVSPSVDLQTCGVCSKLLSKKSSWSSQKIIITNELNVVAVLTCGHVYHAECLENMTPEIDKYDPACPVCTLGEKKTHKLSEKALKAEMDMKARNNKRLRKQVVDSDLDGGSIVFDRLKGSGCDGKASSSSMKSSLGKPFMRRHFSFGSKGSRSPSENQPSRKKGLFWAKSSKI
ncbi:hypothetical protein SLE2022_201040 [Rubroshorea leprosula]